MTTQGPKSGTQVEATGESEQEEYITLRKSEVAVLLDMIDGLHKQLFQQYEQEGKRWAELRAFIHGEKSRL